MHQTRIQPRRAKGEQLSELQKLAEMQEEELRKIKAAKRKSRLADKARRQQQELISSSLILCALLMNRMSPRRPHRAFPASAVAKVAKMKMLEAAAFPSALGRVCAQLL